MKNLAFLLLLLLSLSRIFAQGGIWTWVHGSNAAAFAQAVYGTQGIPDSANTPQALYQAANWIDLQGNFWIFGGHDYAQAETSDLWKYSAVTNMWTWMKGTMGNPYVSGVYGTQGIPSPLNNPGSRSYGSISWTDTQGYLWLFGGYGYDVNGAWGWLSDLWKYDISTNQWTWMQGADTIGVAPVYGQFQQPSVSNTPGGRVECNAAWITDNALWFFGGTGVAPFAYKSFNDLWKFDIGINQWMWVKGPQGAGKPGYYGQKGVESLRNLPSPRNCYTRWKDTQGNFYLWGGYDDDYDSNYGDVWRYNPVTNNWTWIAGDGFPDGTGAYQQKCIDTLNRPQSRYENRTAQSLECSNLFWTYGGFNKERISGNNKVFGDLWTFDALTYQWTWVSGNQQFNIANYGNLGVGAPTNLPPSKAGACLWVDGNGILWLWGGWGSSDKHNDMWKFVPDTSCVNISSAGSGTLNGIIPSSTICSGDTVRINVSTLSNFQISPLTNTAWIDSVHLLLYPDDTTTYFISAQTDCINHDTTNFTIFVLPTPEANFQVSDTIVSMQNAVITLTNSSQNYDTLLWYLDGQSVTIPQNTTYQFSDTGVYCFTLVAANGTGCADTASRCVRVLEHCFTASLNNDSICAGDSALLSLGISQTNISPSENLHRIDSLHVLLKPSQTTAYTITSASACIDTVLLTVHVFPYSVANFQVVPDSVGITQPTVAIINNSLNYDTAFWYLDEEPITIDGNTYEFLDTGTFCISLVVATEVGCADTARHCVLVYDENNIISIPQAFAPNGSGQNRHFLIFGSLDRIQTFQIRIYNRWGEEVFSSNDPNFKWDGTYKGKPQDTGVFVYEISTLFAGEQKQRYYKGNVTLIR